MTTDIVSADQPGFKERLEGKKIDADSLVMLHKCGQCGGIHFRHAGYVESLAPFIRPGGDKRMMMHSEQVKVCVNCKSAFVWINEQVYDVTDQIDMNAWEKTEKEAHKATGPGGQC